MRLTAFFSFAYLVVSLTNPVLAQKKVKYKDIWSLLNTKQYEAAEPFLKAYLKDNTDNPNAYLFMGIMYQEKSGRDDILKQTKLAIARMDSAILFYDQAYKTITEKEVKRNDEYYQAYNRRDLRTGQFGVKLSDIQFDLEKRMESLRERIDRVKMVKHFFSMADTLYKKSRSLYAAIHENFQEERELYLQADSALIESLKTLAVRFDSCSKAFSQFKGSVNMLGKIGYNQSMEKAEIKAFKQDGFAPADFYQDNVVVWDYKTWAEKVRDAIEKEIIPIREHLISYDIEVNKLRGKLSADSTSVRNDLTKLIDRLLLEKLSKYDPRPFPMDVFAVKIADLEYRSVVIESEKFRDSLNLHLQLDLAKKEVQHIQRLDSLAGEILGRDFEKELQNYHHFVSNTYGNATVLKSFLKVMKDFSSREKELRVSRLAQLEASLKWMVINESDSIPLFLVDKPSPFMPLSVVEEKFTVGLHYKDSVTADVYFYSITPSRIPDVRISFPVSKPVFRQSLFPFTKTLTYSDAAGQVFYVLLYSEQPGEDNGYPATLAKIYRSDGLAWSSDYTLPFIPTELSYQMESGEFVIRADAGESVVDKNGKMLR